LIIAERANIQSDSINGLNGRQDKELLPENGKQQHEIIRAQTGYPQFAFMSYFHSLFKWLLAV